MVTTALTNLFAAPMALETAAAATAATFQGTAFTGLGLDCFVDDGNGTPAGGNVPSKLAQAPAHFFIAGGFYRPLKPQNPTTNRPHTGVSFKKTFGVSASTLYRVASGEPKAGEAEAVTRLIASDQALRQYYQGVQASVSMAKLSGETADYLASLSNAELVALVFDPATRNKKVTFAAFRNIVMERLLPTIQLLGQDNEQANLLFQAFISGKLCEKYFYTFQQVGKDNVAFVRGQDIVNMLLALEEYIAACDSSQTSQETIQSYLANTMSAEEKAAFETTLAANTYLNLRVTIAREKQAVMVSNKQQRIKTRQLAAFEAGALVPGLALETRELIAANPQVRQAFKQIRAQALVSAIVDPLPEETPEEAAAQLAKVLAIMGVTPS